MAKECIEPSCDKYRVQNQRCFRHNKAYLGQIAPGQELENTGSAAVTEQGGAEPAALESGSAASKRSIFSLLGAPERHCGLFLNFSGQESLFEQVNAMSDDPAGDIVRLVAALFAGEFLAKSEGVFDRAAAMDEAGRA